MSEVNTKELEEGISRGDVEKALNALRNIFENNAGVLEAEIVNTITYGKMVEELYGIRENEVAVAVSQNVEGLAVEALVKLGADRSEAEELAKNVSSVKEAKERYRNYIMNM